MIIISSSIVINRRHPSAQIWSLFSSYLVTNHINYDNLSFFQ